ncbi:MAG: prepilin-type N-terminal cleavage/methylation domain-containing protein, partial [Betaproteobacteria bacterium]|nr:prepilin-type N-terminal cleavage/methylation domain-containing protein [Betaproteobacteria bacterium]
MTEAHAIGRSAHGFSLIELLFVMACVGVLVAWGLPLIQRHHRAQARTALLQMAHWMERSANANGSYPLPQALPASLLSNPDLLYQFSVISTSYTYTLVATPTGSQTHDMCGVLTLNHAGVRDVKNANSSTNDCWQR